MRLVVINPNTTAEMTAVISAAARSVARADAEIVAVTSATGPESI
ncbi:aspartate/glutamate racemase family protein, partial [uncultured Gordonia sp.]